MNLVIALACAVEPLAARVCLPPQSTLAPAAYANVAWELLHAAETTTAAAASKLMAAADRLCFTSIASRRWWVCNYDGARRRRRARSSGRMPRHPDFAANE